MEAITYLDSFDMSTRNGQKLAKISQEKIKSLKNKYSTYLKSLVTTTEVKQEMMMPEVKETKVVSNPQVVTVATDNYREVIDKFSMSVFEKSFTQKPLTGARKIRVNTKVIKHVRGLSEKMAKGKLEDMVVTQAPIIEDKSTEVNYTANVEPTLNNVHVQDAKVVSSNVSDFSKSSISRDAISPSVDDYLQKNSHGSENGLIVQLTGDVQNLKEETVKSTAILEQLEAKYNALKDKKAQRIKELEEEKLSYTATLEGLTERIKNLQNAIAQEEQSLSGYKRSV